MSKKVMDIFLSLLPAIILSLIANAVIGPKKEKKTEDEPKKEKKTEDEYDQLFNYIDKENGVLFTASQRLIDFAVGKMHELIANGERPSIVDFYKWVLVNEDYIPIIASHMKLGGANNSKFVINVSEVHTRGFLLKKAINYDYELCLCV